MKKKIDTPLKYTFLPPVGVAIGGDTPVVFLLHGYVQNAGMMLRLFAEHLSGCAVFAVEAPIEMAHQRYSWVSIRGKQGQPLTDLEDIPAHVEHNMPELFRSRDLLSDFIPKALLACGVTSQQAYVVGFSQGASVCYALMSSCPEVAKNYVTLSGYVVPGIVSEQETSLFQRMAGMRVLSLHGTTDNIVPVENTQGVIEFYTLGGAAFDYWFFEGGHTISSEEVDRVAEWIAVRV